jgi:hypothetical protein
MDAVLRRSSRLVALRVLLAVSVLAGCAAKPSLPADPGTAAPPNQAAGAQSALAAQTTAQTEFGLLAGGDYGHAWDLWSDAAKQTIARADFITLNTACPLGLGTLTRVLTVRPLSSTSVAIDWQRDAQTGTVRMVYAAGTWHFEPAAQEYQGRLKALMAKRQAAHKCREAT